MVVGAKVCELTNGFLWFVCGNFDVSPKSDRDHGTATTAYRTLGLTPGGTICSSNLSLGLYPILVPCGVGLNKDCYLNLELWLCDTMKYMHFMS